MAQLHKQLTPIGTTELIDFPDDEIFGVPAKIDTGADSSAIWASDIQVDGGKLAFTFFAPGNVFYRAQRVETTKFKTTSVKNSFGHAEFRYKVKIRLRVGDHTLLSWVTLADRSRSTYPVLLGKNFLRNRFVVDVSQQHVHGRHKQTKEILVLGAEFIETQRYFDKVAKLNAVPVRYVCEGYGHLMYRMGEAGPYVLDQRNNKDIAAYDLVYFKSHVRKAEFATAAAEYLHYKGVRFFDEEILNDSSASKLSEYMRLSCHNLPVPTAICGHSELLAKQYAMLVEELGSPFVLKEIASDRGRNNYLVAAETDFKRILEEAPGELTFMAQRYIPNDGFYRIYVLNKEIQLIIWRDAVGHKDPLKAHLNKPAGSANATKQTYDVAPTEVSELAVRAASIMNRQVAGVDIVQDKHTKEWYVLEVNNAPQLRSGSFVTEKAQAVAQFIDKELNR